MWELGALVTQNHLWNQERWFGGNFTAAQLGMQEAWYAFLGASYNADRPLPASLLGKEEPSLIITQPRTLESVNNDLPFVLTAEFGTCVRFMHQVTPCRSHPKLQPLFFTGLLKLYPATFSPGIAFLAWPTSLWSCRFGNTTQLLSMSPSYRPGLASRWAHIFILYSPLGW